MLTPRESGERISQHSIHVKINREGVEKCAAFMADRIENGKLELQKQYEETDVHPKSRKDKTGEDAASTEEEELVDWVLFVSALNFSFWNLDSEKQYLVTYMGTTYNGYLSLCAAINRTLDSGIPLTKPSYFEEISVEKLNELLKGDGDVPCPMIEERWKCLKSLAKVLKDKFDNSSVKLVGSGEQSAEKLLRIVTENFEIFNDGGNFEGIDERVTFHKRAQIFISDLHGLFGGKGVGRFDDIHRLTMFADYRVPQSLQYFGAFQYSREIMKTLMKDELLANGSRMEMEIRGNSIRAVELITIELKKILEAKGQTALAGEVNETRVDYFLWGFRREKAEEMEKFPYHKTRSIWY